MSFGCSLSSSCLWIWLWRGLTIFRHLQEWDTVVAQSIITNTNEKSLKEVFDSREAKDKLYEAKVQRNEKWVIEIQVREEQQEKKVFCLQSSSAYSLWYSVTHSLHCKLWWFKKSQSMFPAHYKNELSLWALAVLWWELCLPFLGKIRGSSWWWWCEGERVKEVLGCISRTSCLLPQS